MRSPICLLVCLLSAALATQAQAQYPWCRYLDDVHGTAAGSTITVYHERATYNCCPDSTGFFVNVEGNQISILERSYGGECLCLCCFDLSVEVDSLAPGTYQVDFAWYDIGNEGPDPRHWPLEIVVPDVGQVAHPMRGDWSTSNCIDHPTVGVGRDDDPLGSAGLTPIAPRLAIAPNPATHRTTVSCELLRPGFVNLSIYSVAGQHVRTLFSGVREAGAFDAVWDGLAETGRPVPSGIYLCGLTGSGGSVGTQVFLLR